MKILLTVAVAAWLGWLLYSRHHPPAAQEAAKIDNAATRYVGSLQYDEKKAAAAVEKMNAGIGQSEKAVGEATSQ